MKINVKRTILALVAAFPLLAVNAETLTWQRYNLSFEVPDGSRACLTNVTSKKSNLLVQIEINYFLGDEARVDAILKSLTEGKPKATKEKKEKKEKQKVQKKGAKPKPIKPGKVADDTPTPLYEI